MMKSREVLNKSAKKILPQSYAIRHSRIASEFHGEKNQNFIKTPCYFVVFILFFLLLVPAFAQETFEFIIPEPERRTLAPEFPEEVPRQFRGVALGMALDELKSALIEDSLFSFRGDRDVSCLPVREETMVETTGLSYIRRAFFQLTQGVVYIMSFSIDTRQIDHYSIFTSFVKKYGEPVVLSPTEAVWESSDTRVSIERPLTVKYIDKAIFSRLLEESRARDSLEILRREDFIADF
jgi:hypothetical protein